MKIALLSTYNAFTNNSGEGQKRYAFQIYENIRKQTKNKDYKNIKIIKFESSKRIGILPSFFLENSFKNFNSFDLLHLLGQLPFINIFNNKCKIAVTAHDFRPLLDPVWDEEIGKSINDKVYKIFAILGSKLALKADFLLSNSTQTKKEAIRLGYPKENIYVVNLGIEKRFINSENKLGLTNKENFRAGYLGSFMKHKNLRFIFQASKSITDDKILFNIYGNENTDQEKLLQHLSEFPKIKFMGFAPEEKIVEIYDSFDVFVFPSLYEGFGLPILEAQARGLPVIIYKYGKIPKEVRKYCFEAESPEHMAQIIEELKENGYNEKERKKAMEYARSFTWERTARETLEIYRKLQ